MEVAPNELVARAEQYAQTRGLTINEKLGYGVHGIVFSAERQSEAGRRAIKVHERDGPYQRERDVYRRLREHGITEIRGCRVPNPGNISFRD